MKYCYSRYYKDNVNACYFNVQIVLFAVYTIKYKNIWKLVWDSSYDFELCLLFKLKQIVKLFLELQYIWAVLRTAHQRAAISRGRSNKLDPSTRFQFLWCQILIMFYRGTMDLWYSIWLDITLEHSAVSQME